MLLCAESEAQSADVALAQTSNDDSDDSSVWSSEDDLAQTSDDDSSATWSSEGDLAQEGDEINSDWSGSEWEDPCKHLAPCAEFFENDPCADAEDWDACHAGDEGQEWHNALETCLENKTEAQWAAELKCWEEHPIEE